MQRRTVLQLGLVGVSLVAIGGGLSLWRPGVQEGILSPQAREIFRAVARAVLDGALNPERTAQAVELDEQVEAVQTTVAGFPSHVRSELSLLLGLLGTAPGRRIVAGLPAAWDEASVPQLQDALQSMRTSSLAVRQQAYHALRDLTNGAFYAQRKHWAQLGYPGPREL